MKPYEYISLLSTIVWIIVPLFYFKSTHFWFFLLLGVSDVVASILWFGFGLSSQAVWIPAFYLFVFSIDERFFIKKIKVILLGFAIIQIVNFYSSTYFQYMFVFLANIIILTIFLKYLYWGFVENNKPNIFYLAMTFYGLLSVYKSVLTVVNINLGMTNFFVITIFQIFIGLILIFIERDVLFSLNRFKP